ncbi:MAG TPA: hypothetical protein VK633_12910 [Verrucomicrobiae bacterium]|nr:hypothetical protein [Verrucomicrobiae bacterium]
MKKALLLVAAALAAGFVYAQSQAIKPESVGPTRFYLHNGVGMVIARSGMPVESKETFRIDTLTGKTWILSPNTEKMSPIWVEIYEEADTRALKPAK